MREVVEEAAPSSAPAPPGPAPLFDLLAGARAASHVVALSEEGVLLQEEWASSVLAVAELARSAGGARWMLACEDAARFSIGLFGLLAAGRTVCLPPGLLPPALRSLAPGVDRSLSDLPAPGGIASWHAFPAPVSRVSARPLPDGTVEFWTSGSTGLPKRVAKRFSQLAAEVATQERCFGSRFGAGPVVGTVPHFHIYGTLFRVLWPLHAGRPFRTESCGDPATLIRALAGQPPAALVSCPAHLSRLPRLIPKSRLAPPPAVVFSSGGPLGAEDARTWNSVATSGVVEIYGSTESGGIAWRSPGRGKDPVPWTPLPEVSLAQDGDGALLVRSPYAGAEPLRIEDAVEFVSGGLFRLLGRLDRIVKLDEKRVSLPEVEAALGAHPWVVNAAVVPVKSARAALGAAVILSENARPLLAAGQDVVVHALREHLAKSVDPVAIPRRWRFVTELAVDVGGKLTAAAVASLFDDSSSVVREAATGGSFPA